MSAGEDARAGRIGQASWTGTAVFAVTVAVAVAVEAARDLAVAVSLVLFAAGVVTFLWAYGTAVARSREQAIGIGGLYFLAGDTAPAPVRRSLLGSLAVQVAVALAAAAARPYTDVAFGILVPVFGLGMAGLWGARHGRFAARSPGTTGRRR